MQDIIEIEIKNEDLSFNYLQILNITHLQRNRKNYRDRQKNQSLYLSGIGNTLSVLFSENNTCSSPHTLIELSCDEYISMKDNFIHLEGASLGTCDGNEVQWYSKFTCRANVIAKKSKKQACQIIVVLKTSK